MDIAKVETSGRSQVVRIPRKFRFKTSQVKISRKGNQIILSPVSQEDKLKAFYAANRGTQATVLWETGGTPNSLRDKASKPRQMAGWTENYIRVTAPYDTNKINTFETIWL